ncbi:AAA family ATPase [Bacillus thuringiensis]|uniref:AAA family ATPase n=1 Tax=Bacillus thuringiensis TaxID=1428 RepID=A0AAW9JCP9_BACTU|nr:AAA family ATPase [Bacillus thuringiensis]MDZ5476414.1 AAA family ATPase [Bacillus thuringiensis]
MQILYLWMNQKKYLENLSLNFGGEFLFDIKDKNLTIEKIFSFIKDFFHTKNFLNTSCKVNSVTGIVGENGTGKSTILESIINLIEERNAIDFDFFIIYKKQNNYYFDFYIQDELIYEKNIIHKQSTIIFKDTCFNYLNITESSLQAIFFSNVYDMKADLNNKKKAIRTFDISTNNLAQDESYLKTEIYNQIMFTKKFEHDLKMNEKINIPKEIQLHMNHHYFYSSVINKTLLRFSDGTSLYKNPNDFLSIVYENTYTPFYENIFTQLGKAPYKLQKNIIMDIRQDVLTGLQTLDTNVGIFKEFYLSFKKSIQNALKKKKLDPQIIHRFLKNLDNNYEAIEEFIAILSSWEIIKRDNNEFYIKTNDPNIPQLFDLYKTCNFSLPKIEMHWSQLSSGEYAFLSLFSRFNSIEEQLKNNSLILIDEGDLYFHPQWQKDWLYTFMDIISYMYKDKNIQIILTTHSPFILSDLPSNNVIFLKKDNGNNVCTVKNLEGNQLTFAANIHDLLTNSFFMHDGLVGKFAQNKINNLVDEILDSSPEQIRKNSSRIRNQIDIIGEPIVKRKLIEIFEDKIKLDVLSINEKIEQLQQQIDELRAIKDDKN